jgi:hypothetical protein
MLNHQVWTKLRVISFYGIVLSLILLSGCAQSQPSSNTIETAIAQTQNAEPNLTEKPTQTKTTIPTATSTNTPLPKPSNTLAPTATNTKQMSVEEFRQELVNQTKAILENGQGLEEVEAINLVRIGESGGLEIEFRTRYASRDNQPAVTYKVIQFFSSAFVNGFHRDVSGVEKLTGGPFVLRITSYSTDGDYRYQSETDWGTMVKVADQAISYDEWVSAANAGFR